jgi:hypothetical protein
MRTTMRFGVVNLGVVVGGAIGGLIGLALGDFGGRSDPENVWFLSLVAGAAVGLAIAATIILHRAKGLGWGSSLVIGAASAIVTAAVCIVFVAWQRRP